MKIIAFDTTNSLCSVALFDNKTIKSLIITNEPSKQAENLLPMIKKTLAENQLTYQQLDGFALTIGPGSFTGVRIALAAVKGLQLITKLPVIAVSNLELMAWKAKVQLPPSEKNIVVYLNARRNQLYTQTFNNNLLPINEPHLITIDQAIPKHGNIITGNGIDLLDKNYVNKCICVENSQLDAEILAQSLAFFAPERFSHEVIPLYIREADVTTPKSQTCSSQG